MNQDEIREFAGADTAYDVAMRRLEEQMRQIDQIDTRTTAVVATASAIAAIFATVAIATIRTAGTWPFAVGVAAIAVVGAVYILVAHFALGAYRYDRWSLRPNWQQLIDFSRVAADPLLKSWVAENCVVSLEANQPAVEEKLSRLGWGYRLLELEAITALIGILAIVLVDRLAT